MTKTKTIADLEDALIAEVAPQLAAVARTGEKITYEWRGLSMKLRSDMNRRMREDRLTTAVIGTYTEEQTRALFDRLAAAL